MMLAVQLLILVVTLVEGSAVNAGGALPASKKLATQGEIVDLFKVDNNGDDDEEEHDASAPAQSSASDNVDVKVNSDASPNGDPVPSESFSEIQAEEDEDEQVAASEHATGYEVFHKLTIDSSSKINDYLEEFIKHFNEKLNQDDLRKARARATSVGQWQAKYQATTRVLKQLTAVVDQMDTKTLEGLGKNMMITAASATKLLKKYAAEVEMAATNFKAKMAAAKRWGFVIAVEREHHESGHPEIEELLTIFEDIRGTSIAGVKLVEAIYKKLGKAAPAELQDLPKALSKFDRVIHGPSRMLMLVAVVAFAVAFGGILCLKRDVKPNQ